jgi:uncharacterized membrane protein
MAILIGVQALVGAIICSLAVPMMQRRVKPNRLYGLRCPATFADEWVWYEANARSGRELFALGLCVLIFALIPLIDSTIPPIAYVLGNAIFLLVGAIFIGVIGWMRANRLLKERQEMGAHFGSQFDAR